jgi:hypothetical protein
MVELGTLLGTETRRRERQCQHERKEQGECAHVIA